MKGKSVCLFMVIFLTVAILANADETKVKAEKDVKKVMLIKSPAFKEGESIAAKYTCDSTDLSPQLTFEEIPGTAKSLALICDDPDAPRGTWVHWVMLNIPPGLEEIPEGVEKTLMPNIGQDSTGIQPVQGINDFGKIGYGGPCPPKGPAHRYYFKLYALDIVIKLGEEEIKKGITKKKLLEVMEGHILAEASIMGKYKR